MRLPWCTIVAFIGLGHMGGPMCARLRRRGLRRDRLRPAPGGRRGAVAAGASAAASVADCADPDVLITMLPGPAQVEAVLPGEAGRSRRCAGRPGST